MSGPRRGSTTHGRPCGVRASVSWMKIPRGSTRGDSSLSVSVRGRQVAVGCSLSALSCSSVLTFRAVACRESSPVVIKRQLESAGWGKREEQNVDRAPRWFTTSPTFSTTREETRVCPSPSRSASTGNSGVHWAPSRVLSFSHGVARRKSLPVVTKKQLESAGWEKWKEKSQVGPRPQGWLPVPRHFLQHVHKRPKSLTYNNAWLIMQDTWLLYFGYTSK